jgi:putative hemolysin
MTRMLRDRRHLAIVRGAAGETLGLVTLEDLVEEFVGEIQDEHDDPVTDR